MKQKYVYILECEHAERNGFEIVEVFDKPKTARRYLDAYLGVDTRKKWKKCGDQRSYQHGKFRYWVTEWQLLSDKYSKEDKD